MAQVKFYRKKDTEIRKVALVDEADNKKVVAIIGRAEELVELGALYGHKGMNEQAWLLIDAGMVKKINGKKVEICVSQFETLEEAKEEAKKVYGNA